MTVYLVDTNIIAYLADVGSPYHENILDRATVDLVIASTAIESNTILVSNDDIYGRVQSLWPDFRWENWTV
jgi:predicted nucleic acid-binding protein